MERLALGAVIGFFSGSLIIGPVIDGEYQKEILKLKEEQSILLEASQNKAAAISERYYDEQKKNDSLFSDNLQLAKRLHDYESEHHPNNTETAGCAIKCPVCPDVSSKVAEDFAKLAREADETAIYAQQCHKWIMLLEKERGRLTTPK